VLGEGPPDLDELGRLTTGWLEEDLAARTGEWAYGSARPLLLAEEFVGEPGQAPLDYKVCVFTASPRWSRCTTAASTSTRAGSAPRTGSQVDPAMDAGLGRWWHLPGRTTG